MIRRWFLALPLLLLAVAAARADGFASPWGATPQARLRVIGVAGREGALTLGLQFALAPGWKIYWRSPGDAGLPPEVDWQASTNLSVQPLDWPVPDRFSFSGLETFGYEGAVVLPAAARRPDPAAPTRIVAAVDFLTCASLCVPNHLDLALDLTDAADEPGAAAAIATALAALPRSDRAVPLSQLRVAVDGEDAVLTAQATGPLPAKADLLVEGAAGVAFLPPVVDATGRLSARAVGGAGAVPAIAGKMVTLTLIDRGDGSAVTGAVAVERAAAVQSLWAVLPIALLGGFILNFMPCVLPVLSMKLLALIGHAGVARRTLRASFLATAAGILVSFVVMAAGLIGARAGGLAIGWGLQFQEPVFLAALAALVTLFACNLAGWFEISLPWWLANRLPAAGQGLAGSFGAGAFATLLATPCSAPFLGTAIGFALTGSSLDILVVFLCLGLGLALPYLLVAAVPGLVWFMPRPGLWMVYLRRALALPLVATALWLLSVIAAESGIPTALASAGAALVAVLGFMIAALAKRPAGHALAAIALVGMVAAPLVIVPAATAGSGAGDSKVAGADAAWQPFDPNLLPAAIAAGRVVLVDVTARWCLTCQVNERLALADPALVSRIGPGGILAMRADWTRHDPAISAYLASFGRYGIPFNVVYGPRAAGGLALPELLTPGLVLDAVAQAQPQG